MSSIKDEIRIGCPMRHENGNCLVAGGFCTAVNTTICEALHNAYHTGEMHSIEKMKKEGNHKQSEWVPVSEPPEENGIYCVMVENRKCIKYKQRTHARYKNGRWLDLYDNWENRCWRVTHWMPLPKPPVMKGE